LPLHHVDLLHDGPERTDRVIGSDERVDGAPRPPHVLGKRVVRSDAVRRAREHERRGKLYPRDAVRILVL
jgi:hypothetical protein